VSLAKELGVEIKTNCAVTRIETQNEHAIHVETNSGIYAADYIVAGSDYHHSETLLQEKKRNYSEEYWKKRVFAPSALLFFIGINKKLKNILHHTLFFDKDFDPHAKTIYDSASWPEDPLFYVCMPSITNATCAPEGCENITILIPIAAGISDTPETREHYFLQVISRMEKLTGEDIMSSVIFKQSYCVNDFKDDYNSYKGNAYGLANTLNQTAFMRPGVKNKRIKNLFYTGQLTVPGPGVPPAIISGKIVAEVLHKNTQRKSYAS